MMKNIFNKKTEKQKKGESHTDFDIYWQQQLEITKIPNRLPYFIEKCINKSVIHFGCTDWPIFNPELNLHIQLAEHTKVLHGFDIDKEGIVELKKYVDQPYFSDIKDLPTDHTYDICLIPETIEHVDNVAAFLKNISGINAREFIITGPNCFAPSHMARNLNDSEKFVEVVHPDHNCWYSPFTLKNVISKYANLEVTRVLLLQNETMVCCEAVKK